MTEADYEQIQQEDAIWPWLADGSMSDETIDPSFEEFENPDEEEP